MTPANDNSPSRRASALPLGVRPRGLCRAAAAEYVGVSSSLFDDMVEDGRMPQPKMANTRTVWDAVALDIAFDALPSRGAVNPWDTAYG
ncbi:XRE family transcriptional regulator [Devosia sp. LC5]|uniref:XRE family transcriptional regulator n=1 Tax=Devosia sp. LC5 TaxID=1502724 RepID=UPI0012691070|nr:XRE family transcriptional regulator [Devosia sp. LC5]